MKNKIITTFFKGLASLMFVAIGFFAYLDKSIESPEEAVVELFILAGLLLGLIGDVFLNLRQMYKGHTKNRVFAIGITAFLLGHVSYVIALVVNGMQNIYASLIMAVILSVFVEGFLFKKTKLDSMGIKIFGVVYLFCVIFMFSIAAMPVIMGNTTVFNIRFAIGAGLFMLSDCMLIYCNFVKKNRILRIGNLLLYYIGQVLIATCIFYHQHI